MKANKLNIFPLEMQESSSLEFGVILRQITEI